MFRCLTTNAARALVLFCVSAMLVGCGSDDKKKDPKVQNPEVGLKQRPEPASPGGGGPTEAGTKGKGAGQPGASVGVQ